jgi:hypothetical protein
MHEKRVGKAYMRELVASIVLYTVLLMAAIRWGRPMPEGLLRTLVLLSPMIGFFAALWVIARHFGRIDEYQRMRMLENVALASAVTAGLTFTYGFLETAGYPKLSMFTVWIVLCGSVGLVGILRKLLDK